jgi:hypothetical protein
MTVKMGGITDEHGTITCSVCNDILQSYFSLEPGEMRKLSREDRTKSQPYVDEGGRNAKAALAILTQWQLKLVHSANEFFTKPLSDDAAILQLVSRD